jgi:hypothetical protein
LKTLLQSLSFEILFFSCQKQTDLDQFLTFFEKIPRIYQENSRAKLKNITLVSIDTRQVAKHDQAEFQQFFTFFKKIHNFAEKLLSEFQKIPNLSIHFYLSISNAC